MYQLIEEASQVLRTPPPEFDFENPPEDPAEITKNLAEAMDKFCLLYTSDAADEP